MDAVTKFEVKPPSPTVEQYTREIERVMAGGDGSVCFMRREDGIGGTGFRTELFFAPGLTPDEMFSYIKALYVFAQSLAGPAEPDDLATIQEALADDGKKQA